MYQAELIKNSLLPVVGWRPDPKVSINPSLNQSESGLFFQDEHPLLTLENIKAFAPDFGTTIGDPFSNWLKTQTEAGIIKGIQRLVNERIVNRSAKGIMDARTVFSNPKPSTIAPLDNKVVGLEIWPRRTYGTLAKINRIGLSFTTNGLVTLKLFHSSRQTPVRQIELNYAKAGQIQWHPVDIALPYVSDDTDSGGVWFLVYERNLQAILNTTSIQVGLQKYCRVTPFESELPANELWDYANNRYSDIAHGLNLQISVVSDFTSFLINQRAALTDVISKSVAVHLLREMAFNPAAKINHRETNIKKVEVLYEIDGDSSSLKKSGLGYQLDQSIKAVQLDWDEIDGSVMKRQKGIQYKTI